jgi:Kef-type K+ transport system membrane component KefB
MGLEFSLAKVRKHWRVTVLVTLALSVTCALICSIVGYSLELPVNQSLFFGIAVSISSTLVTLQCMQPDDQATKYGQILLGALVVQDLLISVVLGIMPVFSPAHHSVNSSGIIWSVAGILGRMSVFIACSALAGLLISRYFLQSSIFRSSNEQLHTLAAIAICFAFLQVIKLNAT